MTKIDELGVNVVGIKTQKRMLSESLNYSSLTYLLSKYNAKERIIPEN